MTTEKTTTQAAHPWRATLRTTFAGLVAFLALLPVLVAEAGLDPETIPWLGTVLVVAAAVTRLLANPAVEQFLKTYLPVLAAASRDDVTGRGRGAAAAEYDYHDDVYSAHSIYTDPESDR